MESKEHLVFIPNPLKGAWSLLQQTPWLLPSAQSPTVIADVRYAVQKEQTIDIDRQRVRVGCVQPTQGASLRSGGRQEVWSVRYPGSKPEDPTTANLNLVTSLMT